MSAAYDLVVIGGGIAGLTAAGRAAQAGLRVAVLERGTDDAYACNSRYSGGILHIAFHNIREPASALLEVIADGDAAARRNLNWPRRSPTTRRGWSTGCATKASNS